MQVSAITDIDILDLKELQPDGWPDITEHFKFYISTNFCKPIKLTLDEQVIGISTTILYGTSAWLAHIIVHKDYRNKGLGTRITQLLINSVDKSLTKTISLIATPLGEPVYKKLGFEKETSYYFFNTDSPISFKSNTISVLDYKPNFYDDILRLDKTISGEDRAMILEPNLPQTKVYIHANEVLGFYMPSLNEGLVVAKDKIAGIELLKLKLNKNPIAIVPQENNHAISFLKENDFKHYRSASRMRLGASLNIKNEMMFNRIGGNMG